MIFARGERRRDHALKSLSNDLGGRGAEQRVRLEHRTQRNPERLVLNASERFFDLLRPSPDGDLKEAHSKTVDISTTIDEGTIFLFRRHIPRRSSDAPLTALENRDAKIGELHLATSRDQDVRGLDVAVDDRAALFRPLVRAGKRAAGFGTDIGDDRGGKTHLSSNEAHQIDSVNPLHGEVVAALGHTKIENRDDIGVAELHREAGLLDERFDAPILIGFFGEDAFDADRLHDTRRAIGERPVDLSHSAVPELLDEEITPEPRIFNHLLFSHLLLVFLWVGAGCVPTFAPPDTALAIVLTSSTEAHSKGEEVAKALERQLRRYKIQTAPRGPKRSASDEVEGLIHIEELFFDVRLEEAASALVHYLESLQDIAIPVDPDLLGRAFILGARIAEARGRDEAFEAYLRAARRVSGAKRMDRRRHPPSLVERYLRLGEAHMVPLELEGLPGEAQILLNGAPASLGDQVESGRHLLEVHAPGKRSERRWVDIQKLPIQIALSFDPSSLSEEVAEGEPMPQAPSETQRRVAEAAGYKATLLSATYEGESLALALHLPMLDAPLRVSGSRDDSGDYLALSLLAPLEANELERRGKVKSRRRALLISGGAAVVIGVALGIAAASGAFEKEPTWHARGKIAFELGSR